MEEEKNPSIGFSELSMIMAKINTYKEKEEIKKYLEEEIDLEEVGKSFANISLLKISDFTKLLYKYEVPTIKINAFCKSLGYKIIGEKVKKIILNGGVFLLNLDLFMRSMKKEDAIEFVEGIGIETIRNKNKHFTPDELTIMKFLLEKKCGYDDVFFKSNGIDLRVYTVFFESFINTRSRIITRNPQLKKYLQFSVINLKQDKNLPKKIREINSLKQWNNFIYNLKTTDMKFVQRVIIPILQRFTASQYEKLFLLSNLSEIGKFLSLFDPYEKILTYNLPISIDFKKIFTTQQKNVSTLKEIIYFIYNLTYIGRESYASIFAKELNSDINFILSKLDLMLYKFNNEKDIDKKPLMRKEFSDTINLLIWNLWLTLPQGTELLILKNEEFQNMLAVNFTKTEDILNIIGGYFLTNTPIPQKFIIKSKVIKTKEKFFKTKTSDDYFFILRVNAGYSYLLNKKIEFAELNEFCRDKVKNKKFLKIDGQINKFVRFFDFTR
ncbi:MAG: hypothetical protein A2Y34_16075 [Spirochaetes bacterium GWC1_27_15]|nr:MAG: hypothetical protein A2Y34_16075 [Spirochaetes bacterium GWC1_27_15]